MRNERKKMKNDDKESQNKRSLHAWMRWHKHSDILSHAMCAKHECDSRNRTKKHKTNTSRAFTCSPNVSRHCRVSCALCWSWFSRLSLVSDVSPFSKMILYVNLISPRLRNSKYKILFFWMLQSDIVLSSSTHTVYQILACFTSRKRVLRSVVFTPPVGYNRPPSAVNDLSVTK